MATETVQMPVMTVEKKPEKVKLTKEERAAKKAATAAKKAAAELEKKKKAEERAAKKAAAELEKKQKAEERAAKKAATELEKKQKADIRAAKKAAKEEKKKTAAEINLPSSLQIQLGEIRDNHEKIKEKTAEDKELQLEVPVKSAEPEEPEEEEEEQDQCLPFDPAAAALVDKVLESSTHNSGNENDTNTPPNSPHRVVAETSPIGDDDSVECDFRAVEEKLQIMKKIILTTRANLTQLETCYSELANLIGTDATL